MAHGALSDQIRNRTIERYVKPARERQQEKFSVSVRDLMSELEAEGFPKEHQHQFCTAIQTKKFLLENSLEIERVDGPRSGRSTTVVVHYQLKGSGFRGFPRKADPSETPAQRARRVTDLLAGRLRKEIKQLGGTAGYMKWVRREGE